MTLYPTWLLYDFSGIPQNPAPAPAPAPTPDPDPVDEATADEPMDKLKTKIQIENSNLFFLIRCNKTIQDKNKLLLTDQNSGFFDIYN